MFSYWVLALQLWRTGTLKHPLPFSHTVSDLICQKSHGDSLLPFMTLAHCWNLCKVKQWMLLSCTESFKSSWESLGTHFLLLGTADLQLFFSQGKLLIREENIKKNTCIKIYIYRSIYVCAWVQPVVSFPHIYCLGVLLPCAWPSGHFVWLKN